MLIRVLMVIKVTICSGTCLEDTKLFGTFVSLSWSQLYYLDQEYFCLSAFVYLSSCCKLLQIFEATQRYGALKRVQTYQRTEQTKASLSPTLAPGETVITFPSLFASPLREPTYQKFRLVSCCWKIRNGDRKSRTTLRRRKSSGFGRTSKRSNRRSNMRNNRRSNMRSSRRSNMRSSRRSNMSSRRSSRRSGSMKRRNTRRWKKTLRSRSENRIVVGTRAVAVVPYPWLFIFNFSRYY